MTRFLVINGSYRPGGTVDQALAVAVATVAATGAEIEVVRLRERPELDQRTTRRVRSLTAKPVRSSRPGYPRR